MDQSRKRKPTFFSAFTINIIFVVFIILGISLVKCIPVKLNPGRATSAIYIDFSYYNASPEIVEKQVTSKLEGVFETVKGIEKTFSFSGEGWGQIRLNLDKNANAQIVRFEILSLIRELYPKLPNEVTFPSLTQAGADKEAQVHLLTYTINGNTDSFVLYKYLNTNIRPKLAQIKGIQKIAIYGSTPYQWEIQYELNKLRSLGIHSDDIKQAIQDYFSQTDLGYTATFNEREEDTLLLMTSLKGNPKRGDALVNIPIKKMSNRIIYLGEIAKVTHKQKQKQSFYRINGLTAVNMVIYATEEANQITLAKNIESQMLLIKEKLPQGYSVVKSYDASVFLQREIQKTLWRTILSIAVLLLFVLMVSRSYKYLLIIVLSLFANLSIAIFFYYILGVEIHLYSLAGITVSLGILIDNAIIMVDHMRYKHNKNVFLAVLAATLTTIGALVVIFFLEKEQRINLLDFAWVVIINLSISILIALFLVPALVEKIPIAKKHDKLFFRRKKRVVRFNYLYKRFILFGHRYRFVVLILGVLLFGTPIYMLPVKVDGENDWAKTYNSVFNNKTYINEIKPIIDKVFGGTLRLFTQHVKENATGFSSPKRTSLNVMINLPQSVPVEQLNEIYQSFENLLSKYPEIAFYQTEINGISDSKLQIFFKKEFENTSFPFRLKSELENKAIEISSADFRVYGVGRGFSNAQPEGFVNSRIVFTGYDYEKLLKYIHLAKEELLQNSRIKKVFIEAGNTWWFSDRENTYIDIDMQYLANAEIGLTDVFHKVKEYDINKKYVFNIPFEGEIEDVSLYSDFSQQSDIWKIMENEIDLKESFKLKNVSVKYNEAASKNIYKENQEYKIVVGYDFIGPSKLALIFLEKFEKKTNEKLPVGFKATIPSGNYWDIKEKKQYQILFLMLIIIYFICAILLESLIQPLVVIAMIPLSFVGIFLIFYVLNYQFDQGGYASFLLVSGLVVNSALYIVNDLNNIELKKRNTLRTNNYIKAFNFKIIPISLTIISTILGLLPFVFLGNKESFWFDLAIGTIGGLVFSVLAIIVFLPLMLGNLINSK